MKHWNWKTFKCTQITSTPSSRIPAVYYYFHYFHLSGRSLSSLQRQPYRSNLFRNLPYLSYPVGREFQSSRRSQRWAISTQAIGVTKVLRSSWNCSSAAYWILTPIAQLLLLEIQQILKLKWVMERRNVCLIVIMINNDLLYQFWRSNWFHPSISTDLPFHMQSFCRTILYFEMEFDQKREANWIIRQDDERSKVREIFGFPSNRLTMCRCHELSLTASIKI